MQIMCIRKGKRLVARILPFLAPEQAADVLMATARNLPFLIKKDAQDEVRLGGLRVSSGWRFLPFLGGCRRFGGAMWEKPFCNSNPHKKGSAWSSQLCSFLRRCFPAS